MKKIFLLILIYISVGNGFGQQIAFQKMYGRTGRDLSYSVHQTTDGGYIIAGQQGIIGTDSSDVWLIKTNLNGDTLWTRTFGGVGFDRGTDVKQTADGGFIITGYTNSFSSNIDLVYLIKTDFSGSLLWSKTYGGVIGDRGYAVLQTTDGGYALTGNTGSFGAGGTGGDVYLIKTNSSGNTLWTKTFGGIYYDSANDIQQTSDGGYIISGNSSGMPGNTDLYLIKTDSLGNLIWTKTYGGALNDWGNSVLQTADGGYIISGSTESAGAGNFDVYTIRTDSVGDSLWTRTFGGGNTEYGYSINHTADGGYVIAASTLSFGAGSYDVYLIRITSNGDTLWTKTIGGSNSDNGFSVEQTTDSGFIIAGFTFSYGAGDGDVFLIKTDSMGNRDCNQGSPPSVVSIPALSELNFVTTLSSGSSVNSPLTIVASGGTITTLCTTVGIPSSIPSLQSSISISPNPTTNNFIITFPNTINKGSIEIYNILGKKIFNVPVNIGTAISQKEIHLANISPGIYFVKVRDGEKEYCQKLVIE